jgi:hypothetical protein
MYGERGQATIEWVGLVLLAAIALGVAAASVGSVDGRSFGGFLSHRIVCAVRGSACPDGADHQRLVRAYGPADAELARRFAPDIVYEPGERQVPVDYRDCRDPACARAPDDRDLDVHTTDSGRRVTVFTRVVHRGGRTYIQYWFYYPDSNSTVLGADKVWKALSTVRVGGRRLVPPRYPGFHLDDWEGYEVRVDRDGSTAVRATSHGHLQWCKQPECRSRWGPRTGWTRVSRGSHSGHIPLDRTVTGRPGGAEGVPGLPGVPEGRVRVRYRPRIPGVNLHERTSTSEGQRLVPLETLDHGRYRRRAKGVSPPWQKSHYSDPEGPGS